MRRAQRHSPERAGKERNARQQDRGCEPRAAAILRWSVLAFSPPLWTLFPLQILHTLSYAATFMASLQLVEQLSTSRNASAAQALNSALSGGVLSGLATMASGPLFDRFGARGYLLMTAMCVVGVLGALRLYGLRRLDSA